MDDDGQPSSATEVFEQRIMPIFRSPEPSSCVQCHLASVDLKDYILPSAEKTFVSLRDQGLIDLNEPAKSKILHLIQMGEEDLDEGARLLHEKTRRAEYEAFRAWIIACVEDPAITNLPSLTESEVAAPEKANEIIRHARKSRLVDSFERYVWSQRMRCYPCHTPNEINPSMPGHKGALKTRADMLATYGDEHFDRLQLFRETPESTMQFWIERSKNPLHDELPILNLENPAKSLIVLKPTSKIPKKDADGNFLKPSSLEPTSHMGGLKMHGNDQSYKSFVAWIKDYANVVGDRYSSVNELPADNWFASNRILRVADVPDSWPDGATVQLFVHSWNDIGQNWSDEPVAFTQGTVTPRRMVNGALFLLSNGSQNLNLSKVPESTTLQQGRYLVKAHVDGSNKLAADPSLLLGADDFMGQAILDDARWAPGFPKAETVLGKNLVTGSDQ